MDGPRRILEIGEIGFFYWAMPERTDTLYASYRADLRRDRAFLCIGSFLKAVRAARRGDYDLIVLHPPFYPGWHPRSFLAAFKFTLFRGRYRDLYGALISPLLFQALRFVPMSHVIAIDKSDSFGIPAHQHFLFDKVDAFLKRELPVDHWQALYASAHRRLPGLTFRLKKRWQRRIAKLKPIVLGIHREAAERAAAAFGAEKKTDVFFAGRTEGNSSVRLHVPEMVEQLRAAGFSVDYLSGRMPYEEYIKRCAQAWITLSPAGLGWDCFRHVEAALAGSVPMVSPPTIHRYKPMVVGRHCLVYYPDQDNIADVVGAALADKERLRTMAREGRDHVMNHLVHEAVARDLLETYGARAKGTKENPEGPNGAPV